MESLKDLLISSYDFSYLDAFNSLDLDGLGYIDFEAVDYFMRSNGKVLSDDEILAFIRVTGNELRQKVNYSDFVESITPLNMTSVSTLSKIESSYNKRARLNTSVSRLRDSSDYDYYKYTRSSSAGRKRYNYESPVKIKSNKKYSSPLKSSYKMTNSYVTPTKKRLYSPQRNVYYTPSTRYGSPSSRISTYSYYSPTKNVISPMKGNEEEHLVKALKVQVDIDREIESLKK